MHTSNDVARRGFREFGDSRRLLLRTGIEAFRMLTEVRDSLLAGRRIRSDSALELAVAAWSLIHGFTSLVLGGLLPLGSDDDAAIDRHVRRLHERFLHGAGWPRRPCRVAGQFTAEYGPNSVRSGPENAVKNPCSIPFDDGGSLPCGNGYPE